jgi:phosphatidylglycerophosphate synthase
VHGQRASAASTSATTPTRSATTYARSKRSARTTVVTGDDAAASAAAPATAAVGKVKAAVQMIAIAALLWCLEPSGRALENTLLAAAAIVCYWVGVGLTLASGIQYLWSARTLLMGPSAAGPGSA